jgi:hypothetical protein
LCKQTGEARSQEALRGRQSHSTPGRRTQRPTETETPVFARGARCKNGSLKMVEEPSSSVLSVEHRAGGPPKQARRLSSLFLFHERASSDSEKGFKLI